jgi:ABC-type Zn uptake system ZnuABC Zn-binding protein ZnuA
MKHLLRVLILMAMTLHTAPARAEAVVLTGHPVTSGLAQALLHGTGARVEAVVPDAIPMNRQPSYLNGRGAPRLAEAATRGDAVVTLRSVWPYDPLYPLARRANIRLVEVDAARPLDGALSGVAVLNGDAAPWLAPTNASRMAEILAADLRALYPADAPVIDANLGALRRALRAVQADAAGRFAALPDTAVAALSNRFAGMAADLGLDVRATFPWEDHAVSDADLAALTALLRAEAVALVLHHRAPAEPIARAVAEAGAALVVLDPLEAGPPADVPAALAGAVNALLAAFDRRLQP